MDRQDIAQQVSTTLGDHVEDYDIDAIVDDLGAAGVKTSVDDVDHDTYWGIVRKHDRTAT
jgi:outer membrane receptor protein involved in Fe transport